MLQGISEHFCTPGGAGWKGGALVPNLGSQRVQITGATYLIQIIDCKNSQKIHEFLTPLRYK